MKRLLLMYRVSVKSAFASAAAYRLDFFISFVIVLLNNLILPLVTLLIYGAGAVLPGWTLYEALLFQSAFMLVNGLCAPFFNNMVWITMENVREGNYDLLLIKPCPVILTTAAYSFSLDSIGALAGGIGVFIFSVTKLPPIGFMYWLTFFYFILCAVMMMFGASCLMSATTFKWVGNSRIFEIFGAVTTFGRYPLTLYPRFVRGLISVIIPVAALGIFPAYALLGVAKPLYYLIILPCAGFMLLGVWSFLYMIRTYQSAGG